MDELTYEPPAITEIADVHELTLTRARIIKHDNHTPDGYEYSGVILTS